MCWNDDVIAVMTWFLQFTIVLGFYLLVDIVNVLSLTCVMPLLHIRYFEVTVCWYGLLFYFQELQVRSSKPCMHLNYWERKCCGLYECWLDDQLIDIGWKKKEKKLILWCLLSFGCKKLHYTCVAIVITTMSIITYIFSLGIYLHNVSPKSLSGVGLIKYVYLTFTMSICLGLVVLSLMMEPFGSSKHRFGMSYIN